MRNELTGLLDDLGHGNSIESLISFEVILIAGPSQGVKIELLDDNDFGVVELEEVVNYIIIATLKDFNSCDC